jgi:hypothetical protein
MYAHKDLTRTGEVFFKDIHDNIKITRMYNKSPIYEIEVLPHADQTLETKNSGFTLDYWGCIYTGNTAFHFVYHNWPAFSMVFPSGPEYMQKIGDLKIYHLEVKELRQVE